ncbi:hypothetical protein ACPCHQ_21765 [Ralstonia thomasii]|uniref:hypothetical protein n=1 Tax=Ralstonia thomasii TaxID=3058596 RepID=UPI003C2B0687
MSRYQVVDVNDSRDFCECCGKTGLKRVVFILDAETGQVRHFGTSCAVAPAKGFGVGQEIKVAIARFSSRVVAINQMAYRAYKRLGGKHVAHPEKSGTWTPADPILYRTVRAEIVARAIPNQ